VSDGRGGGDSGLEACDGRLTRPSVNYHASFLAALVESRQEGRHAELDPQKLADREAFAGYVQALLDDELPDRPRPADRVPQTTLWWVVDGRFVGRVSVRHALNDSLRQRGGHIGYEVRPSSRGRGHATAMLAAALPVAAALGIQEAWVDCDTWNVASRRVIERNGGRLVAANDSMLYFRVPTGAGATPEE
jgi:predicted acetyltransferase